jgi:predicted CxxxxCH...CXXCH cytochrome family protein
MCALAACADPRMYSMPCSDCAVTVHPPGILDPSSPDFHGTKLASENWSFSICQSCHGDDFSGGASGVSCLGCHRQGPTACSTCHGLTGPKTNAHAAHALDCSECHVKPASWDAPGHIVDVPLGMPAPVVFGARAQLTIDPADRAGPPSFDGATCSNVYCHGAALHQAGGTATAPRWDDPTPPGTCDRCHASPPPSHQRSDCATCHPPSAPHIDGIVQVGRTSGCDGCHGTAASPAPPVDLAGNTFTTAMGVGAHQAHLQGSELFAPVACSACHVVPATVTAPGHLAPSPATVTIAWNRTAQTCDTWCHGGTSPVWTTSGGAYCGSCHGIPPASHSPTLTIDTCTSCHPFGSATHVNGVVDVH